MKYISLIQRDKWICKNKNGKETEILLNDFSANYKNNKINFDLAFILIHSTPGENGLLESYLEMKQIPHTTCSAAVSMLTFNKYYCKTIVKDSGFVAIAPSVYFSHKIPIDEIKNKISQLNYPIFIKPVNSGSSVGLSKIYSEDELNDAVHLAWKYDNEILIEQGINGRELTCGVFNYKGNIISFPVTEIIPKNDFFDFEAKYNSGMSDEITPANISEDFSQNIRSISVNLYKYLSCFGVVRFDFIWNEEELFFLEVNTIPGMSEASIVPAQAKAANIPLIKLTDMMIENALTRFF